jgi:DNA-binding response OmpR family regulator
LLIVEDEAPIRDGLLDLFAQAGFDPVGSADGTDALGRLAGEPFDLVVLDLMIPGVDGLAVLRAVRDRGSETPVLILTAKGAEEDIVRGLEAGADDYVTKPFGIRELVARAKGLLRRPKTAPRRRSFGVGSATVDLDRLEVRWGDGVVTLSPREARLLAFLAQHAGRTIGRDELLVEVWGYRDGTIRTRTVDVHVQQLRAKLKDVPTADGWLVTVRGEGYRFEAGTT